MNGTKRSHGGHRVDGTEDGKTGKRLGLGVPGVPEMGMTGVPIPSKQAQIQATVHGKLRYITRSHRSGITMQTRTETPTDGQIRSATRMIRITRTSSQSPQRTLNHRGLSLRCMSQVPGASFPWHGRVKKK